MKNLLLLVFLLGVQISTFSQNEYLLKLHSFNGESPKTAFSEITRELEVSHRYINDSILTFQSPLLITINEMAQFVELHGYEIEDFQILTDNTDNTDNTDKPINNSGNVLKNGNQDCENATMVCDAASFSGNASGSGSNQELNGSNSGCLSWEHQSSWYYINVGSSGTLEMTISPTASDDYDWAIWGPFTEATANANCPPTSGPVRCSWAEGYGDTGMRSGTTNPCSWKWGCFCFADCDPNSENAYGNGWVAPLNVQEDEVYILLIDNYSTSNNPFDLTWGGTAGLECTEVPLPVELTAFNGQNKQGMNLLTWETATETNNDYFSIAHSSDGFSWQEIDKVSGAGNSTEVKNYSLEHRNFPSAINYYRLTQVDFDGKREVFPIISIDNLKNRKLIKRVNTLGQEVDQNFKGIVIEYYDDHTVEKRVY
ncbi:hypothetical protein [Brumimicrobium sp.]|uniref:hypothetical protein n=1 Tax=Brumimicrobium sp. TaxID=2029867 RepID=UPI003A953383